jgi:hypothetical protein
MRRLSFVSLLSFALPSFLVASPQHPGGPAEAPVVHVAPAPPHAAPMSGAHSPAAHPPTAHHTTTHPTSSTSSSTRISSKPSIVKPINRPPVHAAWEPGLPPSSVVPPPSSLAYTSSVPLLLPSSTFFGHHCFNGLGCYGEGRHFRNSGVIVPFGDFGGFYVPVPYYESAGPGDEGDESATNDAEAPPPPQNENADQQAANEQAPASSANVNPFYPPSEPIYEYVFVKRDGTKVFAIAYSLTKDKIQYVTKEGLRRTLSLDSLDFDATEKSNAERGNTINLPSPPPSASA